MSWMDFFQYSRKERLGIYALLVLVFVILLVPDLWLRWELSHPSAASVRKQQLIWQEMQQTDSLDPQASRMPDRDPATEVPGPLFPFDPNTIDAAGLLQLGLRPKTIATLIRYRDKGGRFRKPEDLYRLYGLRKEEADRLVPFVHIQATQPKADTGRYRQERPAYKKPERAAPVMVSINQADSLSWLSLPGIGPALTHRILLFREKLGGFYKLEQLAEVYGLADSVYQQILPRLRFDPISLRKIPVNQSTAAALALHPYIRYTLAREIEAYRKAHGPFAGPEALLKLRSMDPALLEKVQPYLGFEEDP